MIIDFSKISSIKIGPKINVKILNENNYENEFLIGKATNTLISPNASNIAILDKRYKFINFKYPYLEVGGAVPNQVLYKFTKKYNIKGFEFLAKLPGTIGGSIKMNAGVKEYEISNNLVSINNDIEKKDIQFSYRYSSINIPIFKALFKVKLGFDYELDRKLKLLRSNQPYEPSLGSVFKNPKGYFAGKLIEDVKLKGFRRGDILISNKHANFFLNIGNGKFEDMLYLIKLTQKRVFEEFGIKLELEIKIV